MKHELLLRYLLLDGGCASGGTIVDRDREQHAAGVNNENNKNNKNKNKCII
jgi:hypothetical protein